MSMSKRAMGFELLRRQLLESVEDRFSEISGWSRGDSEIERLFYAAFVLRIEHGPCEFDSVAVALSSENADNMRRNPENKYKLIIESQVPIGSYRVDFIVSAWTNGLVWSGDKKWQRGEPRWRQLVVECDGHDYHERTKQQAARDRARDRFLNNEGFDVFRFTGSELWRDPWGCADQTYEWAARGFDYIPEFPE